MDSPIMVGVSEATRNVLEEAEYAALSDAKVLITGESGVGKEIVARLVHHRGRRSKGPLITINCAGVPDTLLESELFGHVKGSFTDAYRDKRGWLEAAHGGTIFMDEVGEMSLRMQAMLLRFLETGEIQRVGADRRPPPVDVRVITATHRDLLEGISNKSFREDLYYRLNVIHIDIAPLRERPDDVPVLLNHFLPAFSQSHRRPLPEVAPEALARLMAYHWPGNVRELRNVAERLVLKCRTGRVGIESLPPEIVGDGQTQRAFPVVSTPTPGAAAATASATPAAPDVRPLHDELFVRMINAHESFWTIVYEPFMAHDLTRATVREIIRMGLEYTHGNYRALMVAFNMPAKDYKRFLNFLRKYQCHIPFRGFRMLRTPLPVGKDTVKDGVKDDDDSVPEAHARTHAVG